MSTIIKINLKIFTKAAIDATAILPNSGINGFNYHRKFLCAGGTSSQHPTPTHHHRSNQINHLCLDSSIYNRKKRKKGNFLEETVCQGMYIWEIVSYVRNLQSSDHCIPGADGVWSLLDRSLTEMRLGASHRGMESHNNNNSNTFLSLIITWCFLDDQRTFSLKFINFTKIFLMFVILGWYCQIYSVSFNV